MFCIILHSDTDTHTNVIPLIKYSQNHDATRSLKAPWREKCSVRLIFLTDYFAISQKKVPPQHIYLLSLHLINLLNKWKRATTRCHHIYLQAYLKVDTPKCCYSKEGGLWKYRWGLLDSCDVFSFMLNAFFSMMRMEYTAQALLCCILWYIKAGLKIFL